MLDYKQILKAAFDARDALNDVMPDSMLEPLISDFIETHKCLPELLMELLEIENV